MYDPSIQKSSAENRDGEPLALWIPLEDKVHEL